VKRPNIEVQEAVAEEEALVEEADLGEGQEGGLEDSEEEMADSEADLVDSEEEIEVDLEGVVHN
jgi:hypothetical protein